MSKGELQSPRKRECTICAGRKADARPLDDVWSFQSPGCAPCMHETIPRFTQLLLGILSRVSKHFGQNHLGTKKQDPISLGAFLCIRGVRSIGAGPSTANHEISLTAGLGRNVGGVSLPALLHVQVARCIQSLEL